ncbi:hypothetical protein HNP37_004275 [Flavobacterium nitrogenifigens]|uniref:Uncharacterized protein n=2 Tax=Flavobacterium TaxID=237 RepID=A0A7W7J0Y1_9FLAO|nr:MULTISPECIES: hypothetical protein [Flavobacterium]MBB4804189.1 hypothetical protein [Flavobacterium nitrogenifigens]MBB6389148.1 hypothetical protein [Flavobacterium notoginsengisoli]
MKNITIRVLTSVIAVTLFTNCDNKRKISEETETAKIVDTTNVQIEKEERELQSNLNYESYLFAENLKNDSFFESDNTNKVVELKNVGISGYIINGNEVILNGIFYDKEHNKAIPRLNNNPSGRSFVSEYFDKKEIGYDEKYKSTYSAVLFITLKNARDVKKLKMYNPSEPVLNYEYKVEGTIDEFRSGFVDLVNIKGKFIGLSPTSNYPDKMYEIKDVELY